LNVLNKIAVVSDIHSNLQALQAVWRRISDLGCDGVYCLGDIVGYGGRPAECVDLVLREDFHCVQGNHDALIADPTLELEFNVYSLAAVEHNRQRLSEENLDWLGALPTTLRLESEALFAHGSPEDRDRYLTYLDDLQDVSHRLLQKEGPGLCFFGHTHQSVVFDGSNSLRSPPGEFRLVAGERMLVNPGSVGQPRDGDPRAAFLWWDRPQGILHFERVVYDVEAARRDILDGGLPPILGNRLLTGR
jgi:diadenosine tetraphosphatase ApaH/serine/threonine PP2A family protein phosphatase